jgi:hypothetical protein
MTGETNEGSSMLSPRVCGMGKLGWLMGGRTLSGIVSERGTYLSSPSENPRWMSMLDARGNGTYIPRAIEPRHR